jgi:hypothetical protein
VLAAPTVAAATAATTSAIARHHRSALAAICAPAKRLEAVRGRGAQEPTAVV